MTNDVNPAIVIVAYNRSAALRRLLDSVVNARFDSDDVNLVISIDHSDVQNEISAIADACDWPHGTKRIIAHPERRGLRAHVLSCAELVSEYGSVILLEDDLYVSPWFYQYAVAAQDFYSADSQIAGISLYAHQYNETATLAFSAYDDGFDNFFMQLPSSWGQCWTNDQWKRFAQWYEINADDEVSTADRVPTDVAQWPASSWKKFFVKYMVAEDQYFCYPRLSLTTNFMDPGTHHSAMHRHLQVPLQVAERPYRFSPLEKSAAVYDAYCEPTVTGNMPRHWLENIQTDSLIFDLYGCKPASMLDADYVVTSKPVQTPLKTWGGHLKPHEANLYSDIAGDAFKLAQAQDCKDAQLRNPFEMANYYHGISPQLIRRATLVGTEPVGDTELKEISSSETYAALRGELQRTKKELKTLTAKVEQYESSTIWRLSRPLRWLIDAIRKS